MAGRSGLDAHGASYRYRAGTDLVESITVNAVVEDGIPPDYYHVEQRAQRKYIYETDRDALDYVQNHWDASDPAKLISKYDYTNGRLGMRRSVDYSGAVNGAGCVDVRWYESVPDMARGAEKAALASFARFSITRLNVFCGVLLALELAPFAGLLALGLPGVQAASAVGAACAMTAQMVASIWFRRPWWPALFVPVASVLAVGLLLRASWLTIWRGGMLWRGTLYPMKLLRDNARLRFP